MYVQHSYKYEGKYYAKIDGVFYEISKEVAMAMFAEYRNLAFRKSRAILALSKMRILTRFSRQKMWKISLIRVQN